MSRSWKCFATCNGAHNSREAATPSFCGHRATASRRQVEVISTRPPVRNSGADSQRLISETVDSPFSGTPVSVLETKPGYFVAGEWHPIPIVDAGFSANSPSTAAGAAPLTLWTYSDTAPSEQQKRVFDSAADRAKSRYPTAELVGAAAAHFDRYDNPDDLAVHYAISVAPGTVSLYAQQLPQRPVPHDRGPITEWSWKSRRRMVRTVAEIDWQPLVALEEQGWIPTMITLTLPGDWLTVAPTADHFMGCVTEWRRRMALAWKKQLAAAGVDYRSRGAIKGIWKKEFQGRGAPHLHVYTCVPPGTVIFEGVGVPPVEVDFAGWARMAWAEIVRHPDPDERRRHREHGVHLDAPEGMRQADPARLAKYFLKHAAPGESSKEYQHIVPPEWSDRPGRFWGRWGLEKAVETVEVSRDDFDDLRRTMRRHSRSRTFRPLGEAAVHRPRLRRVQVLRNGKWRWVTRRQHLYGGGVRQGGYTVLSDGPSAAVALSRAVAVMGTRRLPDRPLTEPPETRPLWARQPLFRADEATMERIRQQIAQRRNRRQFQCILDGCVVSGHCIHTPVAPSPPPPPSPPPWPIGLPPGYQRPDSVSENRHM